MYSFTLQAFMLVRKQTGSNVFWDEEIYKSSLWIFVKLEASAVFVFYSYTIYNSTSYKI